MDPAINNKKSKIRPKKRLGQNFLTQPGVTKKLVTAAALQPDETILEIGAGTGNLTVQLAQIGNKLIAVEKDPEMAEILKKKFGAAANAKILAADALLFDETKIKPPYKIVANLPFYAAAPLIRKFLESRNPPLLMSVIVQKEVAQRINARPPKMNLLAVSTQFYAATKMIGQVSRGCFWPAPKVDAAILQITPYIKEGKHADEKFIKRFFMVVRAGFSHPRKQLANNLAKELGLAKKRVGHWLAQNRIRPSQRPETLSMNDWINLGDSL
jgi:16S rRNA (adenine1518-N6/adenine1519-N6)-dimethyltransferase